MVRRDEDGRETAQAGERPPSRCVSPAGASPAPVSVGAPGSRPQARGGIPATRAGRRKPARRRMPCNGEQVRGPQPHVKPAASTEEQSGGRAAHLTAKATPTALDPKRAGGLGGVQGAARGQGEARNTRGPSVPPSSRRG